MKGSSDGVLSHLVGHDKYTGKESLQDALAKKHRVQCTK